MPQDPRLPPGTYSVEPSPRSSEQAETSFRRWAEGAENAEDFDALVTAFLADHGVEMMTDLVGCSLSMHRTARGYVSMLQERFETWWDLGRPRIAPAPPVPPRCWSPTPERAVQDFLEANLPPGVVFEVGRRARRVPAGSPDGLSETVAWFCTIEDGAATRGAEGTTALHAARRAVAAWREFVTANRLEGATSGAAEGQQVSKPQPLNAPSIDAAKPSSEQKRVS
jgi:hypothetical protein